MGSTFGPKGVQKNRGRGGILHNAELHNVHSSPNVVRVIISRRMRWTAHVAHMV